MKSIISSLICVLLLSCNESNKTNVAHLTSKHIEDVAVEIAFEGQTMSIAQDHLEPTTKKLFQNDSLQLLFREDGNPFQLNLNLYNTNILNSGTSTYTIPDVNSDKVKVDLNFFNRDRDVKRTNKRIIFRKGTITILKLTDNELQMTFEGEGRGMTERGNNFPIKGHIDVNFNE